MRKKILSDTLETLQRWELAPPLRSCAMALLTMTAPSCDRDLREPGPKEVVETPQAPRPAASASPAEGASAARTWTAPSLPVAGLRAVSMGAGGGCALDDEGALHCWGSAAECLAGARRPLPLPLAGRFDSVTGSPQEGCALDARGRATCWGCARTSDGGTGTETTPRFRVIARASEGRFCGIRANGTIAGCEGLEQTTVELDQRPPRETVIAADSCWYSDAGPLAADACAVLSDGSLDCWGVASYARGEHRKQKGPYSAVAVGACRDNICMVKSGHIECRYGKGPESLPGPATKLVAAHFFHCALAGGNVVCFDRAGSAPAGIDLTGPARDVAAHGGAACAIAASGQLRCAGAGYTGPPSLLECGG